MINIEVKRMISDKVKLTAKDILEKSLKAGCGATNQKT